MCTHGSKIRLHCRPVCNWMHSFEMITINDPRSLESWHVNGIKWFITTGLLEGRRRPRRPKTIRRGTVKNKRQPAEKQLPVQAAVTALATNWSGWKENVAALCAQSQAHKYFSIGKTSNILKGALRLSLRVVLIRRRKLEWNCVDHKGTWLTGCVLLVSVSVFWCHRWRKLVRNLT